MQVIDFRDPTQPVRVGHFDTDDFIRNVKVVESRVYLVTSGGRLLILDMKPHLSIEQSADDTTVSWLELPDLQFVLEETVSLTPPRWTVAASGTTNTVRLDRAVQEKYFRLRQSPENMVWIPPGTFTMGSPETEPERALNGKDETEHEVTITRGFWMGRYEVTQSEYMAVMGVNPSFFFGTTRPVEGVSRFDATDYCGRLTEMARAQGGLPEGFVYRLPTEAEWEYACRAGTSTAFHFGNALRSGMANFQGTNEYAVPVGTIFNPDGISLFGTAPVGSYQPNAWGLYDMHGNVWERCHDWFGNYPSSPVVDPTGPTSGIRHIHRGGSWNRTGADCRSAWRGRSDESRFWDGGFRVVLARSLDASDH